METNSKLEITRTDSIPKYTRESQTWLERHAEQSDVDRQETGWIWARAHSAHTCTRT